MESKEVALKTMRVIARKGARGGLFKTHELREDLGFNETSEEAHYMHNVIARLKKQNLIGATGDRKRNQYLRVLDEEKLRKRIDGFQINGKRVPVAASATVPQEVPGPTRNPTANGPRRVVYLEDRVDRVEHAVEDVSRGVEEMRKGQEELRHRIDELIEMWS